MGWEEPLDFGGYMDVSYVVEKKEASSDDWVELANSCYKRNFRALRLTENQEYQFRIWAENDSGRSKEPLMGKKVVAKNQFTVPGSPSNVTPEDISKNSITLTWNTPKSDGGRPITGYVIEKQAPESTKWVRATPRSNLVTTKAVVDRLIEGETYKFRVYAVNDAGAGEPCQAPKAYKIKPMKAKPTIDLAGKLHNVHLKAGERINLDVLYEGSPLPSVEWRKNGDSLVKSARMDILDHEYRTRLAVDNAVRTDSGMYEVTLSNEYGQETYRFVHWISFQAFHLGSFSSPPPPHTF